MPPECRHDSRRDGPPNNNTDNIMSKARDHHTPEYDRANKARFDWLRTARIKGYGRSFRMGSPMSGKNRAERERLSRGFGSMGGGSPLLQQTPMISRAI